MSEHEDNVGSVGEEAAKLFGALQDWARETGSAQAGAVAGEASAHLGDLGSHVGHGEDCRICPVCRAIRVFRETSPEVKQHLAAAAGSLAQAVSLYLSGTPSRQPTSEPSAQHIDLDED